MDIDDDNSGNNDEIDKLLNSFKESLIDCLLTSKKLSDRLENNEFLSDAGISLFDLKNQMFTNYLINLTEIIKNQFNDEQNNDNDEIRERIVEERIVLEKLQPLEDKLKYQIDNLMKTLNSNRMEIENNPLNARPNFSFDINDDDDDDLNDDNNNNDDGDVNDNEINESKQNNDDDNKLQSSIMKNKFNNNKNQIYVPPKLAQMKFEDEKERKARNLERAKKRAINCSIINELRKEFDDQPEEEFDGFINKKSGIGKFLNQKKKYEEEHFIRLNLTKKQKAQARKLSTINTIGDDITKFEDISVLNIDNTDDFIQSLSKKKMRKNSFKRNNNKKKKKIKKRH